MQNDSLEIMIGVLTALPFVLAYWLGRFAARRRLAAGFRTARPLRETTLQEWTRREWLDSEQAELLPGSLDPASIFYEWAWVDRGASGDWRLRIRLEAGVALEDVVRDAWDNLPEAQRTARRERLASAVRDAGSWWGGVERGWNRRPLAVLSSAVGRKQRGLPLLPMDDLTAAPLPGPVRTDRMAEEAEGPELLLALALLRRSAFRFTHPLAPQAGATGSLIQGLSARVATDFGRKVGAGLGAALGPIGSMVGQYLGELAGSLGGKALAEQALPAPVSSALKETESALARLGEVVRTDGLIEAAREPAEAVLEVGKALERVREQRSRALRERIWPTAGLAAVEETMRVALREMENYRAAGGHFVGVAREAPETVAGGMILQNPWMVRRLPEAVERLNAARASLNRAARVLRRPGP